MPYKNKLGGLEKARSIGHVPIVENAQIQERLRSYRLFSPQADFKVPSELLAPGADEVRPEPAIRWVMSFDGSPQEVAVREQYPSTRVGYLQIAGVLVNLDAMLAEQKAHLVDPAAIQAATNESLQSMVLPGSNVCRQDMPTVRDSWRAEIFEVFRDYKIEQISLLDIFMLLVSHSDRAMPDNSVKLERCSSESCSARDITVAATGSDCPTCKQRLFPTDALRVHEEVSEEHSNLTALGRLMTILEQVTMIAFLSFLYQRKAAVLGTVGFIVDGPLAIFGPSAWMHTAILHYIQWLHKELTKQNLAWPVIIGIEKTGQFADHANAIRDAIPTRALMCLPDSYIYGHILTYKASASSAFGRDTYYGQKFFYKTAREQLLTITIPKPPGFPRDAEKPSHYPQLPRTLALLDKIGTNLYDDALIPIALAHSFASIPLRTGSKVLKLLSQELLGLA